MSTFTPSGSAGLTQSVSLEGATNPQIVRVAMTSSGTEYSYTLPVDCKQFQLKLENGSVPLQVAYVSGESSTNYYTVPRYCFYAESSLNLTNTVTLYFQASLPSQTAELVIWT